MTGGREKVGVKKGHAQQLFKTDFCKFLLTGRCRNGNQCSYAHDKAEMRAKPDLSRTSMCPTVLNGGNCVDMNCRFAHEEGNLRATCGFFKMKMCSFARSGQCRRGDSCRFAHNPEELQPRIDQETTNEGSPSPDNGDETPRPTVPVMASRFPRKEEGDQRSPGRFFKMKMCGFAQSGRCRRGENCRFAHSPEELRPSESDRTEFLTPARQQPEPWPSPMRSSGESTDTSHGFDEFPPPPVPEVARPSRQGSKSVGASTTEVSSPNGSRRRRSDWAEGGASDNSSGTDVMPNSNHSGSSMRTSGGIYDTDSGGDGGGEPAMTPGPRLKNNQSRRQARNRTRASFDGGDWPRAEATTSLLIMNVPTDLTQGALISMFEDLTPAMRGKLDFFYCPWHEREGHSAGFAAINFPDEKHAAAFQGIWQNKELMGQKLRVVRNSIQGQMPNLEHFSKQQLVPCTELRFRPLFRDANGELQHLPLKFNGGGDLPVSRAGGAEAASTSKPGIPEEEEEMPRRPGGDSGGGRASQHLEQSGGLSGQPWQQAGSQTMGLAPGMAMLAPGGAPYAAAGYPGSPGAGVEQVRMQTFSGDMPAGPPLDSPLSEPTMANYWGQPQDGSEPGCAQPVQFPQVVCYMMVPVEAMIQPDGSFSNRTFQALPPGAMPAAAMPAAGFSLPAPQPQTWESDQASDARRWIHPVVGG
jgi:RNA recognition motif-containing protein